MMRLQRTYVLATIVIYKCQTIFSFEVTSRFRIQSFLNIHII